MNIDEGIEFDEEAQYKHWRKMTEKGRLRAVIDPDDFEGWKNLLIDQLHKKALSKYLCLRGDEKTLDLGCGTGRITSWLANEVLFIVGLDPVDQMISLAKKESLNKNNARFIQASGSKLPFKDGCLDITICCYVLCNILGDKFIKTVTEIARVLREGGNLLLIDKIGSGWVYRGDDGYITRQRRLGDYLKSFLKVGLDIEVYRPVRGSHQVIEKTKLLELRSKFSISEIPCLIEKIAEAILLMNEDVREIEMTEGVYIDYILLFKKRKRRHRNKTEIEVSVAKDFSEEEWLALSQSNEITFYHSNEWRKVLETTYGGCKSIVIKFKLSEERIVYLPGLWVGVLQNGKGWIESSYAGTYGGLVSVHSIGYRDIELILKALKSVFEGLNIGGISIIPNPISTVNLPLLYKKGRSYTHILDINKEFNEIWNHNFTSYARNRCRKAEKCGVKIYVDNSTEAFLDYYEMYLDSAKRWGRKNPPYPLEFFINIAKIASKMVKLWVAELDNKRIAGILLFYGGDQVIYGSGAFYKQYAFSSPNNLLIKEAIRDACRKWGYFNFGSSLVGGRELVGVRQFKESFGPKKIDYNFYQILGT
ncbi:TPA: hypothetical protein DCX15_02430 [bacterium]|nr:hypothetical protein [bacterium]